MSGKRFCCMLCTLVLVVVLGTLLSVLLGKSCPRTMVETKWGCILPSYDRPSSNMTYIPSNTTWKA